MMEPSETMESGFENQQHQQQQPHSLVLDELNSSCGGFLTQPLSPLSGFKEMGLIEELGDCQHHLKDSASDLFARYLREDLFDFPASTAPAAIECGVSSLEAPATLNLECSYSNVPSASEQPQPPQQTDSFLSKPIEIEGIDDIFDFNPDSFIATREKREELLEELAELPDELHDDLISIVGTELPRTPSGETLLEVGQLSPDALWKLKAYVSPFSPSEEQRRGEIELKRKATPELFEDLRQYNVEDEDDEEELGYNNYPSSSSSSTTRCLKYRRRDADALTVERNTFQQQPQRQEMQNENMALDEEGEEEEGQREEEDLDDYCYETKLTSARSSSGCNNPSLQKVQYRDSSARSLTSTSPPRSEPRKSEKFQIHVVVYRITPHPNDEKPYHCDFEGCGKKFTNSSNLLRHIRVHTEVKPYVCCFPNCGKAFSYKTVLMEHAALHNGAKPFECEVCGKKFGSKANHRRHIRVHTGEKPFVCSCGKTFSQSSNMKQHSKHCNGKPS